MNVLFVGGGSGGHFFPCITLINYFIKKNNQCFYIGGKNKYEEKKKDYINCPSLFLELSGFNNNIKSMYKMIKSYQKNKKIIKDYLIKNKINKVVLFGNYESLIVGIIAKKLNIPYYIHEQNSELGRANNLLQFHSEKIFTTFKNTTKIKNKKKVIQVGNPRVVKSFHQKKSNRVLVILGSLGSKPLLKKLIEYFNESKEYEFSFVAGENVDDIKNENIKLIKYFDHNKDSFNNYDFIITRGGATTLLEIAGFAIPCLIIPSPNVINNHQEKNAISFCKEAAGEWIKESEIDKNKIIKIIDKYLKNKKQYLNTQIKLYDFALTNTKERMYQEINEKNR